MRWVTAVVAVGLGAVVAQHLCRRLGRIRRQSSETHVFVMYGTVGGTAQRFADMLGSDLRERGMINVLVSDGGDSFRASVARLLNSSKVTSKVVLVFVVATSGSGELPPALRHNWLQLCDAVRVLRGTSNISVRAATFALGDMRYVDHYCEAGKLVCETLNGLGVASLINVCSPSAASDITPPQLWLCNGGAGLQAQERLFSVWCDVVCSSIKLFGQVALAPHSVNPPRRKFHCQPASVVASDRPFLASSSLSVPTRQRPARVPVVNISQCVPNGDVFCLMLDISGVPTMAEYEAGDHCGVYTPNSDDDVIHFLRFFVTCCESDWHAPRQLTVAVVGAARASGSSAFPVPVTTWWSIAKWYLDISGVPAASTVRQIIRHCDASRHAKVEMLSRVDNVFEALAEVPGLERKKVVLADILREHFPLCSSTAMDCVCECVPLLQPRLYSIGSDGLTHPHSIHLYIRVVPHGHTTQYLRKASPPVEVYCFVQRSVFHLPQDHTAPLILIGPGTGVAPLIGFLHRRAGICAKKQKRRLGTAVLFHGCRTEDHWTYYFEKIFAKNFVVGSEACQPVLNEYHVCVSRHPEKPRQYVQDAIRIMSAKVCHLLLDQRGSIYVCGDAARMATEVRSEIRKILLESGRLGDDVKEVEEFFHRLQKSRRYCEDIW